MSRNPRIKDIPKPDDASFGARVGEAVSRLLGTRGEKDAKGEPLDRAITPRDLLDDAFRSRFNVGNGGASGTSVVIKPGSGSGSGDGDEPDLTPPPQVTGLKVTAGLANMIVEWDAALYQQGHGHGQTNLYVAKKDGADPVQATFVDAVLYASAGGALTIIALPADIGVRWHVWAKWQSKDGVESVDPAGGTNGVIGQAGKIGQFDLAPLIIEAGNLAAQDFGNLVLNPDGRSGASGWAASDSQGVINAGNNATTIPWWGGPYLRMAGRDFLYGKGFKVQPGEQYKCAMQAVPEGGGASPYDLGIGLYFFDTADNADANVPMLATTPNQVANLSPAATGGLRTLQGYVTIPPGAKFAKPWIVIDNRTGTADVGHGFYMGAIDVRRRIDDTFIVNGAIQAYHLAANSIAVGTAAIQAGAIINFMLGTGSVDDAKIANLSAAKISVGDGTVGGILKSANYVPGTQGWYLRPGDGYFEASNAVIRGGIFASYGTIGGLNIGATYIMSTGWVSGVTGFRFNSDGTGQIGGLIVNAQSITSANFNGFGTGTSGFGINYLGDVYINSVFARGHIEALSGTFAGALVAATGNFAGQLSAATGTFAGALSAATGTFSGTLTANAINAVSTINLAGNSVTVTAANGGFGAAGVQLSISPADIPAGASTVRVLMLGETEGGWTQLYLGYSEAGRNPATIPAGLVMFKQAQNASDGGGQGPASTNIRMVDLPPGTYTIHIMSGVNCWISAVLAKR